MASSSSSIVPYGISTSSGLANNRKSNLRISFNIGKGFNCDMCNKTITDYLCFCNECRKYLHPQCAGVNRWEYEAEDKKKYIMLPALEDLPVSCRDCLNQAMGRSQDQEVVSVSSITSALASSNIHANEHMLSLIHKSAPNHELIPKDHGDVYTCSGCQEKGFGPHHACQSEFCDIRFHEECKSPRLTMTHPFFRRLRFDFCPQPNFSYCKECKIEHSDNSCNACGMYVNGYFYRSTPDDKNHLHPCCANLPRQINCSDTGATMVLQQKTTSKCCYCKEIKVRKGDKYTKKVWSYASVGEDFHLHVGCIIKMLSDLKYDLGGGRNSRTLTLRKKIGENDVTEIKLDIAARAYPKEKWEKRFKKFMKYAKIALGAIISAFLGDPTTLVISLVVALVS